MATADNNTTATQVNTAQWYEQASSAASTAGSLAYTAGSAVASGAHRVYENREAIQGSISTAGRSALAGLNATLNTACACLTSTYNYIQPKVLSVWSNRANIGNAMVNAARRTYNAAALVLAYAKSAAIQVANKVSTAWQNRAEIGSNLVNAAVQTKNFAVSTWNNASEAANQYGSIGWRVTQVVCGTLGFIGFIPGLIAGWFGTKAQEPAHLATTAEETGSGAGAVADTDDTTVELPPNRSLVDQYANTAAKKALLTALVATSYVVGGALTWTATSFAAGLATGNEAHTAWNNRSAAANAMAQRALGVAHTAQAMATAAA